MSIGAALLLLAALAAFGVFILFAMSFVFAALTGWRTLARRYPGPARFTGARERVNGAVLGEWGWNAPPLFGAADDAGIVFHAVPPFGIAFRPVRLPWPAIASVSRRTYLFFDVAEVRYGEGGRSKIGLVPGTLVETIEARLGNKN